MAFLSFACPAKLNLFLRVIARRSDGYHWLQSAFRLIDYGDTLAIEVNASGRIKRHNPLPGIAPEDDLCVRAAHLLQQQTGCRYGATLRLEKRLPIGGGLGGGSSNAATTLMALNHLWDLNLSTRELQQLGLKLGADVPVFIFGRDAWAQGIGEILQPIQLPYCWYLVLVPPIQVSTAEIFGALDLTSHSEASIISRFTPLSAEVGLSDVDPLLMGNDLQAVVCKRYPVVATYLDYLNAYQPAMMTGSGACVFSAFNTQQQANTAMAQIAAKLPSGARAFVAKSLDKHPLLAADGLRSVVCSLSS